MVSRGSFAGLATFLVAAFSAVAVAVAQAPGAPVAATGAASDVTTTGAKLAGTVTPSGQATTYAFDYGTSAAYGSSTATADAGDGTDPKAVTTTLTGLQPGTTYHFRVAASNASGTAAGTDATFTTQEPPAVSTGAPVVVSASQATVAATVDPNGLSTKLVFDYGTTTAYGSSTSAQDAGQGTTSVTLKATLSGLKAGTTYHVRARAVSDAGTANGADRTFKTSTVAGPAAVTGTATGVAPQSASLPGTVDPNGSATQAYAQYGTSTKYGATTPRRDVGSGTRAVKVGFPVAGLKASTTYHFRIVGVNSAGTTSFGADKSFKTKSLAALGALSAAPAVVAYGHGAQIAGQVTGTGASGAAVALLQNPFPFAGWTLTAQGKADTAGRYAFGVGPLRATTRFYSVVLAAGVASQTKPLRVGVRPAVRIAMRRISGKRLRFTGTIRPSSAATVYLRKVGARSTVTVRRTRSHRVDALSSSFRITIRAPKKRSQYRIRVRTDSHALVRFDSAPRAVRGG